MQLNGTHAKCYFKTRYIKFQNCEHICLPVLHSRGQWIYYFKQFFSPESILYIFLCCAYILMYKLSSTGTKKITLTKSVSNSHKGKKQRKKWYRIVFALKRIASVKRVTTLRDANTVLWGWVNGVLAIRKQKSEIFVCQLVFHRQRESSAIVLQQWQSVGPWGPTQHCQGGRQSLLSCLWCFRVVQESE